MTTSLKKNKISSGDMAVRLIAFYLPQYHPIPENDEWWGKGFTEWTTVAKARPLFPGHNQPRIPSELGFYDLRLPEVRKAQADLAREYGIYGFCYYHYWFNGKLLLDRPLKEVLRSKEPDFPFCICWANENWTRVWDGGNDQILIQQNYSDEDDLKHIRYLCEIFQDDRYIRIDGKPFFLIYRANKLPDPLKTTEIWREEARRIGIGELFLCRVESFPDEHVDPTTIGFDASVEFQPDWTSLGQKLEEPLYDGYQVYRYGDIVQNMLGKERPPYHEFSCVTPQWDNSPRRKENAVTMIDSSPHYYERWLSEIVDRVRNKPENERYVFINAWNEWGEGNYLEPDLKLGRSYLEATRRALNDPEESAATKNITQDKYKAVESMIQAGRLDEAIIALDELLTGDPNHALAHNDLGALYFQQEKTERALMHLEKAAQLNPNHLDILKNLADAYLQTGRAEEAITIYEKILIIEPKDLETLMIVGTLMHQADKKEEAALFFKKVLSIDPGNILAKENLDLINAWNGCAKGNYQEPDEHLGSADLKTMKDLPDRVITSTAGEHKVSSTRDVAIDWTQTFDYQKLTNEEIAEYSNIAVTETLREGGIHAQRAWEYWFRYLSEHIWKTSLGTEIISFCNAVNNPRLLSLGCGYGGVELEIAQSLKKPYEIIAVDINEHILTKASTEAKKKNYNIRFCQLDLNFVNIPEDTFDLIFAHASLHHLLNLEHVFHQIYKGLKKNGRLIVEDIIGKTQILFWKENVDFAIDVIKKMPVKYKSGISIPIIAPYREPSMQKGMEGIRQEEIPSQIDKYFTAVKMFSYGSFIRMICTHPELGKRLDPDKKSDREYLENLFLLDLEQIEKNKLRPTEMLAVYEKREWIDVKKINADGHVQLGVCHLHQGDKDQAVEHFKSAVELDPDNQTAQQHLAEVSDDAGQDSKPVPACNDQSSESPERGQGRGAALPSVSIIIPCNQSNLVMHRCIETVIQNTNYPNYDIVVVGHDIEDILKSFTADIKNDRLKPFLVSETTSVIAGCNAAAKAVSREYLVVLDPLAIVTKGWLAHLLSLAVLKGVGAVTPKIISHDKKIIEAGFSLPDQKEFKGNGEGAQLDEPQYNYVRQANAGSGFCMMISKNEWIQSGGLDNGFSNFNVALADLGLMILSTGKPIFYHPHSQLVISGYHSDSSRLGQDDLWDEKTIEALRPCIPFVLAEKAAKYDRPKVLILGVYLANQRNNINDIVLRLSESENYDVEQCWVAIGGDPPTQEVAKVTLNTLYEKKPKFQIMNELLAHRTLSQYEYIIIADDDIILPYGFLDEFLFLQSRHQFALAQPARTGNSYIDHPIVGQQRGMIGRETRFVEIGPLFSVHHSLYDGLFPFDAISPMGWGYENVWSYQVSKKNLKMGIIDHTPMDHSLRKPVQNYDWSLADQERNQYLEKHPHYLLEHCFTVVDVIGLTGESI